MWFFSWFPKCNGEKSNRHGFPTYYKIQWDALHQTQYAPTVTKQKLQSTLSRHTHSETAKDTKSMREND